MKKIIIVAILFLGILTFFWVFKKEDFFNFKYLTGENEFVYFPKEIRQKYNSTVQKVDVLIQEKQLGDITSQSKDFNLEVYVKIIQTGVLPYLQENDQLKKDVENLIQEILNYTKGRIKQ